VLKGSGETALVLKLNTKAPDKNFTLMVAIGIRYGELRGSEVTQVKYAGNAKVLMLI
jgi:hypothetical protein